MGRHILFDITKRNEPIYVYQSVLPYLAAADERKEWCEENLSGEFTIVAQFILFTNIEDALAYKLKWE